MTIVHKANVVRATDGLFFEEAKKVAAEYPEIAVDDANVDAICMWLLKNPMSYDVLVAPNLYGDIISDLVGPDGRRPRLRLLGEHREKLAVFEPRHGSAPKYAGQNKVNPIATILAAKMMLDLLGEKEKGAASRPPSRRSSPRGRSAPTTWAARPTTLEMGEAVARAL